MKTKYRFIENGPVVVCIATKSLVSPLIRERLTLKVKTIARVNTDCGDVFDSEKGRKLAALRAEVKLNEKYSRICERFSKILIDRSKVTTEKCSNDLEIAEKNLTEFLSTL